MNKTNIFENEVLELFFNNEAIADIGDALGLQPSATAGVLYIVLYSVMPTDSTNGTEATFTGYARQTVARITTEWDISGGQATNVNAITFPTSTSTETIAGCGISFTLTGVSKYFSIFTSNSVENPIEVINGSIIEIKEGQFKINED